MVVNLDHANTVVALLVGAVTLLGGMFVSLRYIIRAETSELRTNGGSSLKDAVNRIEADGKATKAALATHIEDSKRLIDKGMRSETEIRAALSNLAAALPIVAASTPPEGD